MGVGSALLNIFARIFSRNTLSILYTLGNKIITWTLLLFRKKAFLLLAIYTTFQETINALFKTVSGTLSWMTMLEILGSELYTKFVGAAPKILEGLKQIQNLEPIGIYSLWTGLASIYIVLFIYRKATEFKGLREVEWPEKVLVIVIWVLLTSSVHGTNILIQILAELESIFEVLNGFVPEPEVNNTTKASQFLSNNTSK